MIRMPSQDAMRAEPDMMAALGPLLSYENSALRELVEDDTKVEEYVKNLAQSSSFAGFKDMKMAQNKSLAEYNLSLEPAFESGKGNLKELSRQIESLCRSVQEKEDRLKGNSGSVSAETALALLQAAAAESEEETEKLADSFYQKEMEVEDFLEKFQEMRKGMHLRKVKAEKMVDLVSHRNSRNSGGVRRAAPLPPYPMGPNFFNNQ